jgi:hypothetical protein
LVKTSADGWLVSNRLKPDLSLPTFPQNLGCHLLARPTPCGNAQLTLQVPQILNPGLGGLADLLIGNRIADTNVHAAI